MSKTADYAVVYDISSDKERDRVAKTMTGFGFRIQQSVFECRLDKKGIRELTQALHGLQIKTGFIRIYKLHYHYEPRHFGNKPGPDIDDDAAYIV